MAAKAEKWSLPLVEKQRIWYNILHDAPSPSGKAGDFDSPIVGSTPAGATKSPVILKRLAGLFASLFPQSAAERCKTQRRWIFLVGLRWFQPFRNVHKK